MSFKEKYLKYKKKYLKLKEQRGGMSHSNYMNPKQVQKEYLLKEISRVFFDDPTINVERKINCYIKKNNINHKLYIETLIEMYDIYNRLGGPKYLKECGIEQDKIIIIQKFFENQLQLKPRCLLLNKDFVNANTNDSTIYPSIYEYGGFQM